MTLAAAAADFDDRLAMRNVVVLAIASALAGGNAAVVIATGGLVGQMLGGAANATLPITTFVLGTALATLPASMVMRELGRRTGFVIGTIFGALAGFIGAFAIWTGSFPAFMVATGAAGIYQAFVVLYRFAATDTASPGFRPKAVSWVLAGGVFAAFLGPQVVIWTKDFAPPYLFAATYLAQGVIALVATFVVTFVKVPPPGPAVRGAGRPLAEIVLKGPFLVALLCGALAHALMNFVMTASPLAMIACNHSVTDAALAIQWHIIGMYLPSFFTGHIIARYGKLPVLATGLLLLAGCGVVALTGIEVMHFWVALVLLGVGWNFAFVTATTMVADFHRPEERNKVQGFNDFVVFGTTAVGSWLSGKVLAIFGWATVNVVLFPAVVICLLALVWLARQPRAEAA